MKDFITVTRPGVQMASGAASVSSLLPTDSAGNVPRFVRVAATAPACVRLGKTNPTATGADTQVQPGDAVTMHVPMGYDSIAVIQVSAAGIVQISPLENTT